MSEKLIKAQPSCTGTYTISSMISMNVDRGVGVVNRCIHGLESKGGDKLQWAIPTRIGSFSIDSITEIDF